jgi:hypothetical protein
MPINRSQRRLKFSELPKKQHGSVRIDSVILVVKADPDPLGESPPPMPSSSETAPLEDALEEGKLSRVELVSALAGLAVLALTAAVFFLVPTSLAWFRRISGDGFYRSAFLRQDLILAGVFLAAFCLAPASASAVRFFRQRWRDAYTYLALLAVCAFLWAFLIHAGRWQFGGFDFNILIETGWRQILGQRPYVDFPTTTPPGFNLGAKYAFELFGPNWDANLYFSAIFACLTFLWIYRLMTLLSMGCLASLAMAFAIECAAMLTLCFWWYNNSVLILAAIFFLSCLAYASQSRSVPAQCSYFLSLTLLSLMKPNIAGLTIVGGVFFLLLVTDRRMRLILLTLGAAAAVVVVLAINHVSIPAMLESYLSVAKSRGGIGARFGYRQMTAFEKHSALCWIAVLSIPLFGLVPRTIRLISRRDWRGVALSLFFPLALLIALYGLATNGEFRDVECTVLLAAGGVMTFGLQLNGVILRRLYIAIVCATIAGDLYYGAARIRVYGIGPHIFFEWQDNQQRVDNGFLKNMRVSSRMIEIEREVKLALDTNPGPYYFGTRLDFNYAVFGLRSPDQFPAWWHPGTSFPLSTQTHLIQVWEDHRFQTLIFLKPAFRRHTGVEGYTYYPQQFLDAIDRGYTSDERYPEIVIYQRHTANPGPP